MNKYYLIAATAMTLISSAAYAAEPFDGPYFGVQVGSDNYNTDINDTSNFTLSALNAHGVEGGLYAGYDLPVSSNIFVGLEGTAEISDARFNGAVLDLGSVEATAPYTFGIGGRLGAKLNDNTALYARVGWAHSKLKLVDDVETLWSEHKDGVRFGGGLQTYVTPNASVKVEYGYTTYGTVWSEGTTGVKVHNQQVQLGIAYHF